MGQKITVQSITSKDGGSSEKPWTVFHIVTDKGVKFSSFDKKMASIKQGAVIELDDVEVNEKGTTIKKWHQLQEGIGSGASSATSYNGGESPEKRQSIEDQTRAHIIADLFKAEVATPDLVVKLQDWLMKLGTSEAPRTTEPTKTEADSTTKEAIEAGEFANVGQFLTACNKQFGMTRQTVLAECGVDDPKEIKDLNASWQAIRATHEKPAQP